MAAIIGAAALLIFAVSALAQESNPPPIAQPLVREGEFARQLVESLKMTPAPTEAEAENMLTAAGIAPKKGWIADYPVTPDIVAELETAVQNAARSGAIGMEEAEALQAFEILKKDMGLRVTGSGEAYAESEPPARYEGEYPSSSEFDNYYESEGPPVVTYYPPPYPYYGLYGWVPYPFWYSGFFFSGFFVLRDFHRPIYVHNRPFLISNHYYDRHAGRLVNITPHRNFLREPPISGRAGTATLSGREGTRQGLNTLGNSGARSGRSWRAGSDLGPAGSGIRSRSSADGQSPQRFNGNGNRSRGRVSAPEGTNSNYGSSMRRSENFSRGSGGETRMRNPSGRSGEVMSPSARGTGGFSERSANPGRDRGGWSSSPGNRGGGYEFQGSPQGGSSGRGGSFNGFGGGGGRGWSLGGPGGGGGRGGR
jgi:hypothetical protein